MAQRELKVVISAADDYSAVTNKFNSAMSKTAGVATAAAAKIQQGWGTSIGGIKTAYIGAAVAITSAIMSINKAWNLAETAANFAEQKNALDNLARQYGLSADQMLGSINRASGGTVAALDAITVANKGLILGLNPAQLDFYTLAAKRFNDALGGDTVEAFDKLTTATQTGNVRQLKALGIVVDLESAYKKYGGELTLAAKQAINFQVIEDALNKTMQRIGPDVDTAADRFERMSANIKDLKLRIGELLLPVLSDMADGFTFAAKEAGKFFDLFKSPAPVEKITMLNARIVQLKNELAALEVPQVFSDWDFLGPLLAKTKGPQIAALKESIKSLMADLQAEMEKIDRASVKKTPIAVKPSFEISAAAEIEHNRQVSLSEKKIALLHKYGIERDKDNAAAAKAFLEEKEITDARYSIMGIQIQNEEKFNSLSAQGAQARANITGAANQAMQDQMLALVETGKFSTAEFGKVIVSQVKMELAGIAAISAIKALYYGAVGLGLAAMGDPRAIIAFNAAAGFALISGAALAATAGVQALFGGQTTRPEAGSVGGEPVRTTSVSPNVPSATIAASTAAPTQNVTVIVQNGTGDSSYWQKLIDDVIVPGINNATSRNINLTVRTA